MQVPVNFGTLRPPGGSTAYWPGKAGAAVTHSARRNEHLSSNAQQGGTISNKHFFMCCTLAAMLTLFPADSVQHEEERLRQKAQSIGFPRVVVIPVWNLVFGALGFLFLVVWTARLWPRLPETWRSDHKFTVLLFVAVPLFILYAWLQDLRHEIRNRSLLELGKLTVGHVTSQETVGGKSKKSQITYTFRDDSGFERSGTGTDRSRKYQEGMPLLIFFDQSDPAKSVAACCTTWRLKSPDGEFLNLD